MGKRKDWNKWSKFIESEYSDDVEYLQSEYFESDGFIWEEIQFSMNSEIEKGCEILKFIESEFEEFDSEEYEFRAEVSFAPFGFHGMIILKIRIEEIKGEE